MLLTYAAIVVLAVLPIYTGAYASLRRPESAPSSTLDAGSEEDSFTEGLSASDALFFPLLAGCMLGGLYLLITYVSKDWVNWLLNFYMLLMGFLSNTHAITKLLVRFYPRLKCLPKYSFKARGSTDPKTGKKKNLIDVEVYVLYISTGIVAFLITASYAYNKNWIASNIFGLSFAFNGIQLIALDSFKTGMILLSGLFLYDVYFVFGTEIMVTVAQGIEAPIKIVFPRDVAHDFFGPAAMLGLGDIVLPGVYCALALRYDLYHFHKSKPKVIYKKEELSFSKPFFHAAMIAYVFGLVATVTALHLFKVAQPALLYLSPACILSTLVVAWSKQDIREMWSYREISQEERDKNTAVDERKKS